jgi:hypothetical protein
MTDPHPAEAYVTFTQKLRAELEAFRKSHGLLELEIDSHHKGRISALLIAIDLLAENVVRECNQSTRKSK